MSEVEFTKFPKIGRWSRPAVVTEKLDGTNAAVGIVEISGNSRTFDGARSGQATTVQVLHDPVVQGTDFEVPHMYLLYAQSRKRIITPEDDNFGFARWVVENATELVGLGPGVHFGEWWGLGIQRGYGLDEKRFSLFNVHRWTDDVRPTCCHVVPTLAHGEAHIAIESAMRDLHRHGSLAAPGFPDPEGVVVYHTANGSLFKKTFDGDDVSKYALEARRLEYEREYGIK